MSMTEKAVSQKISPIQRAQLFSQLTRKHIQQLSPVSASAESTVSFNLPKVRLGSRIRLLVEGTLNLKHASETAIAPVTFAPFSFIKRVTVESNLGYKFFSLSGIQLYLYNLLRAGSDVIAPKIDTATNVASVRNLSAMGKTASSSGTDNVFRINLDLPFVLNDRDPIGLLLLQNQETVITVTVEFGKAIDLASTTTGFTAVMSNMLIKPAVETFSIPKMAEAFPDLSILKMVQSTTKTIGATGDVVLELPPGLTYRKLLVWYEDANGAGVPEKDLSGDFELVFNQADTPIKVNPYVLSGINQSAYGNVLPTGLWVFDFSDQGLPNYGGARDYIDTEDLTEFWFKFNATKTGKVVAIYETLAKLQMA
jgi:hypothetical protein